MECQHVQVCVGDQGNGTEKSEGESHMSQPDKDRLFQGQQQEMHHRRIDEIGDDVGKIEAGESMDAFQAVQRRQDDGAPENKQSEDLHAKMEAGRVRQDMRHRRQQERRQRKFQKSSADFLGDVREETMVVVS